MPNKELTLRDTMILYDRDMGISIYPNIRSYDNLTDDAEWLLERTPQKSRGFIIRPIAKKTKEGVWIGEYNHNSNQIGRQDRLFTKEAAKLGKTITDHTHRKTTKRRLMKEIEINHLKERLKTRIIQDFKYYTCPTERFYQTCTHVEEAYTELTTKHGKRNRIPYTLVAQEIAKTKPCQDVIVCPLMTPNLFERVLNLDKALKSRKLGRIRLITSDIIEIA